jgi:hypothetical protein
MIARYNKLSFLFGVPGILLQVVGAVMRQSGDNADMGLMVQLVGTGLLIAGLCYYAQAKGRNPAWCLMGFLSIIGLIVLACLEDRAPNG